MSGSYGWHIRPRTNWGAPQISQWRSMPYMITGFGFALFASYTGRFLLENAFTALQPLHQRTRVAGEVVRAEKVGFGFWRIGYVFKLGNQLYYGNRVAPGSFGHYLVGEWIWPAECYDELTKVGSEITVLVGDMGNVPGTSCVDPAAGAYYLAVQVGEVALYCAAALLLIKKWNLMNRFHMLHSTQPGLNLLKRQQLHESLGRAGPGPVDLFMQGKPLKNRYFVYSRRRWEELLRQNYEEMSLSMARERNSREMAYSLDAAALERQERGDAEAHSVNRYVEGSAEDREKQRLAGGGAPLPRSTSSRPPPTASGA